jgi:hypothetical protein
VVLRSSLAITESGLTCLMAGCGATLQVLEAESISTAPSGGFGRWAFYCEEEGESAQRGGRTPRHDGLGRFQGWV